MPINALIAQSGQGVSGVANTLQRLYQARGQTAERDQNALLTQAKLAEYERLKAEAERQQGLRSQFSGALQTPQGVARPDMRNHLAGILGEMGETKSAVGLAYPETQKQPDTPATIQEWNMFQKLSPDQKREFLTMKRANPALNLGDVFGQPDQLNPGQLSGAIPVGIAPERNIEGGTAYTLPGVTPAGRGQGSAAPQITPTATDLPVSVDRRRDIEEGAEKDAQRQKQRASYASIVTQDIDQALEMIETSKVPLTGAAGWAQHIPGSPHYDLARTLDTIRANAGFDKLQQMRESSPTGGALGAVSDFENRLLQATIGNLDQAQSKDQIIRNIKRVREIYERIINEGITPEQAAKEGLAKGLDLGAGGAQGGWSIQRID